MVDEIFNKAMRISETVVAIAGNAESKFHISGFCHIVNIKGATLLSGASLRIGLNYKVQCPPWHPAYLMQCRQRADRRTMTPGYKKKDTSLRSSQISELCSAMGVTYAADSLSALAKNVKWLLLCRGTPLDSQEWLEACEDQSFYCHTAPTGSSACVSDGYTSTLPNSNITTIYQPQFSVSVLSAVLGSSEELRRCGLEQHIHYPFSWIRAVDRLVDEATSTTTPEVCYELKIVISGAKGLGKSTCLRYAVNRLLSAVGSSKGLASVKPRATESLSLSSPNVNLDLLMSGAVCVIDCDLGQPEFSPPGIVSLHILAADSPLLAPPHLNMHYEAELSFFIGDVTAKNEPALVIAAVRRLYERYTELVRAVRTARLAQEEQRRQTVLKSSGSNAYSALLLLDDGTDVSGNEDGGGGGTRGAASAGTADALVLPLVVNTDGFVKHLGAEVLGGILEVVRPTHQLHLSTAHSGAEPEPGLIRKEDGDGGDSSDEKAKAGGVTVLVPRVRQRQRCYYHRRRNRVRDYWRSLYNWF